MPTIATGDFALHAQTLTANTVLTVTFPDSVGREIDIISHAPLDAAVYFTLDGSTPTIGGARCYFIPAGVMVCDKVTLEGAGRSIKLISTGAPTFSFVRGH